MFRGIGARLANMKMVTSANLETTVCISRMLMAHTTTICHQRKWKRYGAKGITVCEDWKRFELFKEWALSHGYADHLTIDRIDSSKGYHPDNCRWSSVREQANNKQRTIWIEYEGERMQLSYWADRLGFPYHTLYDRLYRYGWTVERAFTEPIRRAS